MLQNFLTECAPEILHLFARLRQAFAPLKNFHLMPAIVAERHGDHLSFRKAILIFSKSDKPEATLPPHHQQEE